MLPFPIKKEIRIFAAYAKEDEEPVEKIKKMLKMLKRLPKVSCYDRDISPGREWQQEELKRLEEADIILLLVSWHFLTSDYCYSQQLKESIKRHEEKKARVIPIILQNCPWNDSDNDSRLHILVPLPEDGKPFETWSSWADALMDIYSGIKKVIGELQIAPSSDEAQEA